MRFEVLEADQSREALLTMIKPQSPFNGCRSSGLDQVARAGPRKLRGLGKPGVTQKLGDANAERLGYHGGY